MEDNISNHMMITIFWILSPYRNQKHLNSTLSQLFYLIDVPIEFDHSIPQTYSGPVNECEQKKLQSTNHAQVCNLIHFCQGRTAGMSVMNYQVPHIDEQINMYIKQRNHKTPTNLMISHYSETEDESYRTLKPLSIHNQQKSSFPNHRNRFILVEAHYVQHFTVSLQLWTCKTCNMHKASLAAPTLKRIIRPYQQYTKEANNVIVQFSHKHD